VRDWGDLIVDVSMRNTADAGDWGALVPLTVNHDNDGTVSGDLITATLAGSRRMGLSKTGDLTLDVAGKGIVVKSPDGSVTKRIGIDNSGAIVATTP
jgi:hypothetical protein